MARLFGFLKWSFIILLVLLIGLVVFLYTNFGGGKILNYQPGKPILPENDLELVFSYEEPIGNVAASKDSISRVFFTIHPESRPANYKLCEIVDGQAMPFPNKTFQELFVTPLGLYVDQQERLWVIDHGNHAIKGAKLFAFDLRTNKLLVEYEFPSSVAETGSFLNDLTVTPDGKWVFIADVSFFARSPSLIIFDVDNQRSRSLLDGHPSVKNKGYVPVTPTKKMRFFGGLVDLMPGIDGIDVNPRGSYVYYAAMSHDELFRVPVNYCKNFDFSDEIIADKVEKVGTKPLSDGIRVDENDLIYITDIEHQSIAFLDSKGVLKTLIQSDRIRWADGLSFGGDKYCYLADSDIPNQMLQSKAHINKHKPYHIFRFPAVWY